MENGNFPSNEKKGKYDVRIKAIKFDSGMDRVSKRPRVISRP